MTSRFLSKTMNISTPWCDMSSGMHCGLGLSSERKTGNGEACISAPGRCSDLYSATGHCRDHPTGQSMSTCHKRKPNSNRSGDVFVAAALSAMPRGSSKQRTNSACNQRFVVAAARPSKRNETTNVSCHAQYTRLSPLFVPRLSNRCASQPLPEVSVEYETHEISTACH